MSKTVINLNAEEIDLASIVKTQDCYRVGEWSFMYNEGKNPAKFTFKDVKPRALKVTITGSTGWVRFLRPLDNSGRSGIYDVLLTLRALTIDPASKYQPYIFVTHKPGYFEKHSKLNPCEGGFETKLSMSAGGPQYWIGFETVDKNIELRIDHIRLVLAKGSSEITKIPDAHKTVALPLVASDQKSVSYAEIEEWNRTYESKVSSDELGFLLEYAERLRRVQMPETFLGMIRYLVVRYSDFSPDQQVALATKVRNALQISHDEKLVELIYQHCPGLLSSLDISEEILFKLAGLDSDESNIEHQSLGKHAYFALQNQPKKLFTLIHRELLVDMKYLESNPSGYCALANTYVAGDGNSGRYLTYLNQYLAHYKLPRLNSVELGTGQCMAGMNFNASALKPSKGPLVSIMMSAFQAEETIGYAIESLLMQTYQDIEILVCDDCSDDKTLQVALTWAAKDERVRVFQSKSNQGTYNIRNDLIAQSRGEYLTFQDSDDFALPCRIEEQISVLVNEHKSVCFSEWLRLRNDGSVVYFHDGNVSRFCVVSAMAHRSVFERMPPFRSALVAADTEFYEQCKRLLGDEELVIVRKPLILGLWGDGSLTKRENLNADHSGFVAHRRRAYAEIAARQRILGDVLVTDNDVNEVLKDLDIYCKPAGVVAVNENNADEYTSGKKLEEMEIDEHGKTIGISDEVDSSTFDNTFNSRVA